MNLSHVSEQQPRKHTHLTAKNKGMCMRTRWCLCCFRSRERGGGVFLKTERHVAPCLLTFNSIQTVSLTCPPVISEVSADVNADHRGDSGSFLEKWWRVCTHGVFVNINGIWHVVLRGHDVISRAGRGLRCDISKSKQHDSGVCVWVLLSNLKPDSYIHTSNISPEKWQQPVFVLSLLVCRGPALIRGTGCFVFPCSNQELSYTWIKPRWHQQCCLLKTLSLLVKHRQGSDKQEWLTFKEVNTSETIIWLDPFDSSSVVFSCSLSCAY